MDEDKHKAFVAIILLGVVSLFGDFVYEGGRACIPQYLQILGATAGIVGIVGGLGEFIGYGLRLVSGYLADSTRAYWFFTFLGYTLIIAIPLMGFPLSWQFVAALIVVERLGKAFRSPSRDAILSMVSRGIGSGKAFGVHETLDQIGGIIGPLAFFFIYAVTSEYSTVFIFSFIPFIAMIISLVFCYRVLKSRASTIDYGLNREDTGEKKGVKKTTKETTKGSFFIYTIAVLVSTLGLINILLINFRAAEILSPTQSVIMLLYTVLMASDAAIAFPAGYFYDRFGRAFLFLPFALTVFPSLLVFVSTGLPMLALSYILFGVVLGMQESIYRAAVADLTPIDQRGKAYGLFNTVYGVGLLGGGAVFGIFMDFELSVPLIAAYIVCTQAIALFLLWKSLK
jgi:MFS family permease